MRRKNLIWTAILTACLIAASTAFGGVTISSNSVDFAIEGEGGTLRVSGPANFQVSQSFKGQDVSFSVFDSEGGVLADGLYKYEVAITGVAVGDREDHVDQGQYLTGTFSIEGGSFVNPGIIEGGFNKDQVFLDDIIVDGSACIGFDCVSGESFGFDTLRLKENNLRIKAQDTSNSASFPTRDWQITFNDTSNGGANKFAIDDIDGGRTPFTIEAGAPSHSLYVEDGGRLGLGTSTPVVDIHVKSGNTPTLRLEQDGSSGFGAQTWDVAGNEANFFIRDASNGSTLPFRIFPDAPSNALTIEATTGDIGMGTTSPDAALDVEQTNGTAQIRVTELDGAVSDRTLLRLQNNGGSRISFVDNDAGSTWLMTVQDSLFRVSLNASLGNELDLDANGNLFIRGGLTVNQGTGNQTFPDYVFEPDYELMPMTELANFINREKHLPNVMSRQDVKNNRGIDMTQLQLQILEKVEELTLYTLEQERTIEELTARLKELEAPEGD